MCGVPYPHTPQKLHLVVMLRCRRGSLTLHAHGLGKHQLLSNGGEVNHVQHRSATWWQRLAEMFEVSYRLSSESPRDLHKRRNRNLRRVGFPYSNAKDTAAGVPTWSTTVVLIAKGAHILSVVMNEQRVFRVVLTGTSLYECNYSANSHTRCSPLLRSPAQS